MINKPQQSQNNKPAVELVNISKSFTDRLALNSVNLSIDKGRVFCICGPNASGKTTLLKIIAGLLKPDSGSVKIAGIDIRRQNHNVAKSVGLISHKPMVYPQLTVSENLMFFARLYGLKDKKTLVRQLLKQTDLLSNSSETVHSLSRGTIQRLAVARALIHNPDIILADEPFTGLDNKAKENLLEIISNLENKGKTVVITTHNTDLIFEKCGHIIVLDKGKLIFQSDSSKTNLDELKKDYLTYARQSN